MGTTFKKEKDQTSQQYSALVSSIPSPKLSRSTKSNRENNEKIFLFNDIFQILLSLISDKDFFAAMCTCKTWRRLCDVEENWKIIVLKSFGSSLLQSSSQYPLENEPDITWKDTMKISFLLIDYIPQAYIDRYITERKQIALTEKKEKKVKSRPERPYSKLMKMTIIGLVKTHTHTYIPHHTTKLIICL
jgi:hypothetical protein